MGDRANYVLIQNGVVDIRYSQMGATTIFSWMQQGPEPVIEMINGLPSKAGLMDDTWCEGTIYLDIGRRLSIFSSDHDTRGPRAMRAFMSKLRKIWETWEVYHAPYGVLEAAARISQPIVEIVDSEQYLRAEDSELPKKPRTRNEEMSSKLARIIARSTRALPDWHLRFSDESETLVTFVEECESITFELPVHVFSLLLCGPHLIPYLRRESIEAPPNDRVDGGFTVDVDGRLVRYWSDTAYPASLDKIRAKWPGWELQVLVSGLLEQFSIAGLSGPVPVYEDTHLVDPPVHLDLDELFAVTLSVDPSARLAPSASAVPIPPEQARLPAGTRHGDFLQKSTEVEELSSRNSRDNRSQALARLYASRLAARPQRLLKNALRLIHNTYESLQEEREESKLLQLLEARLRIAMAAFGLYVGDNLRFAEAACRQSRSRQVEESEVTYLRRRTLASLHLARAQIGIDQTENGRLAYEILCGYTISPGNDQEYCSILIDRAWAAFYSQQGTETIEADLCLASEFTDSSDPVVDVIRALALAATASPCDFQPKLAACDILAHAMEQCTIGTPVYWELVAWLAHLAVDCRSLWQTDSRLSLAEISVLAERAGVQLLGSGRLLAAIRAFSASADLEDYTEHKLRKLGMAMLAIEEVQVGLRSFRDTHQWISNQRHHYDNFIRLCIHNDDRTAALAAIERGRCRALGSAAARRSHGSSVLGDSYDEYRKLFVLAETAINGAFSEHESSCLVRSINDREALRRLEQLESMLQAKDPAWVVATPPQVEEMGAKIALISGRAVIVLYIYESVLFCAGFSKEGLIYTATFEDTALSQLCSRWGALLQELNRKKWSSEASRILGDTLEEAKRLLGPSIRAAAAAAHLERVAVVISGVAGSLPIAALFCDDASSEALDIVVAPSLALLDKCTTRSSKLQQGAQLVVVPDGAPRLGMLEGLMVEQTWSKNSDTHLSRLSGAVATRERVLREASKANLVHFACHGEWNPDDILRSGLRMSQGTVITVEDFLGTDSLQPGALVILAACESGIGYPGEAPSEEYGGIAAGCLLAGASAVVASLWPVHDVATFILMYGLHSRLSSGMGASQALMMSQCRLKDMEVAEIGSFLRNFGARELSMSGLPEGRRPFSAPFYWAGFQIIGLP